VEAVLREALEACGKSMNHLAGLTGIHQSALNRFRKGDRSLTLPAVSKLCEALGLELRPVAPPEDTPAAAHGVPSDAAGGAEGRTPGEKPGTRQRRSSAKPKGGGKE
jgi:transcriptional regulator with XRE-family HTH domain